MTANNDKTTTRKKRKVSNKVPSLVKAILTDLFVVHWFLSLLVIVLIITAMLQAKTSHDVRRAVATTQELREQSQQLQIDWQALRLEMTSLTEADRISRLARKNLNMIKVTTENEKVITL